MENIRAVAERELTDELTEFLKLHLPIKKKGSAKNFSIAVDDLKFGKKYKYKNLF